MAALEAYAPKLLGAYDAPHGLASEVLEFLSDLYNGPSGVMLLPLGDLGHAVPRGLAGGCM